jgi:hypothetical protein
MENNVIHLAPGPSAVFSADQTAIQDAWRAHYGEQRRLNTSRVILFAAISLGVLLVALGVLIWALSPHPVQQTVVQAPPVTVNVPQQEPPQVTVNVTAPDPTRHQPAMLPLSGAIPPANSAGSKTVIDFSVFHRKEVGRMQVTTGWSYETVEDKSPKDQWCYIGGPSKPIIANNAGRRDPEGVKLAKKLGYSDVEVEQALAACQWFKGLNRNVRDKVE